MSYKLVALDIDGTLIDDNHNIPKKNVEVIKKLKTQGIQFVVVTGRLDLLAKDIVRELGIDAPILGCNGATVRNLFTNETFYIKEIESGVVKEVFEFFLEEKICGRMFGGDIVYYFGDNGDVVDEDYKEIVSRYLKIKEINEKNIDEILEIEKITKIVYMNDDAMMLDNIQQELKKLIGIEVFKTAVNSIDIVDKSVSKGKALLEYAKEIGIEKEEIVAMGDSENDFSMLSRVGYPVTLENGEECLKKIAKFITKSNNEAGVAFALEEIFRDKLN